MKKLVLSLSCSFLCYLGLFSQSTSDFYSTDRVKEMRISFQQDNWAATLDSFRVNGNEMLVGTVNVDGMPYKNVGIRYRGSRSFKVGGKRNPLFLKLNFIDKGQKHEGHETIKLSNATRDPSLIREVLGYEIARKYMVAPQANYVKVYINNQNYGLFTNIEAVDDEFLAKHFGNDEGTFVKSTPDLKKSSPEGCLPNVYGALAYEEEVNCYLHNYEIESEEGWGDLIQLTNILNNDIKKIEEVLDVDQTLWMLAFNTVLVNLSSYSGSKSQNYYLYQKENGQFVPIIWDLNLAFGSYKSATSKSDLTLQELQELDPLLHLNNAYKPLISQLLKNPKYKKMYLSHIRTLIYDNFENGWYEERAKALQNTFKGPFIDDKYQAYTYRDLQQSLTTTIGKRSKIPGIVELMSKRSKYLKKHPVLRVIPPMISDIALGKREKYASQKINEFVISATVSKRPEQVTIFYRYSSEDSFLQMSMMDDGKRKDKNAGDKTFTATIPVKETGVIEYYIVAENAAAITYSPANYMFEQYSASVAEIN